MTRIYDSNDSTRTVEITMRYWDNNTNEPTLDWSADFFDVGGLPYDEERHAYRVPDVDYCIDQANDWLNAEGDYRDEDGWDDGRERQVFVEEV